MRHDIGGFFHHLAFHSVVALSLILLRTEPVQAIDDVFCARYATIAVEQNDQNISSACGFTGPMWHSNYEEHAAWCIDRDLSADAEKENLRRANALKSCGSNPVCSENFAALIELREIFVHDEADGSGNAEPYLWPVFFKIDDDAVFRDLENPLGNWVFAPGGEHENVGTNGGNHWDAGDVIPVPSRIGVWGDTLSTTILKDDQANFGVIVTLLEEDDFPPSIDIKNKAYPAYANNLAKQIRDKIKEILASVGGDGSGDTIGPADLAGEIEQKIQEILVEQLSDPTGWWNLLFPGIALFVNIDDFIGVGVFVATVEDMKEMGTIEIRRRWHEGTGSEDGDFEIFGLISGHPVCR